MRPSSSRVSTTWLNWVFSSMVISTDTASLFRPSRSQAHTQPRVARMADRPMTSSTYKKAPATRAPALRFSREERRGRRWEGD